MTIDMQTTPPQWHTIETPYHPERVSWTPQLHDAVMFGDTPCPYCNDENDNVLYVVEQLGDTDQRRTMPCSCPCQKTRRFKRPYIQRLLPTRYQRNNLWTLQPSSASKMSLQRQGKVLEFLRNNPDDGYFFFGAPGTSKTTFAAGLVRHALERDWRTKILDSQGWPNIYKTTFWIHYLNWDAYIQSLLDYQNHPDEAQPPTLSPRLIRENKERGRTSCIAIEEVDKSRLTEFKANKLFELVCAIDDTQSQLIMTTNHKSEESFQSWLYKTDNEAINLTGEPIWRRIVDNCKVVECRAE